MIWQEGCEEAPVIFIQASELPKGALVEFQVNFHTGRRCPDSVNHESAEDDDQDDEDLDARYSSAVTSGGMSWELSTADRKGQGSRGMIYIHGQSPIYTYCCGRSEFIVLIFRYVIDQITRRRDRTRLDGKYQRQGLLYPFVNIGIITLVPHPSSSMNKS